MNNIALECAVTLAALEQDNLQVADPASINVGQRVCSSAAFACGTR